MIILSREGYSRKYIVNKNIFLSENALSFYLLGVYFTDGSISDAKRNLHFELASKDENWIKNIRNVICPSKPIYSRQNYYLLRVSDIDCMNWLIEWGCTPRKSKTASILKSIPLSYQKDFLRGVIDGDGSISGCYYKKRKNNKTYTYHKKTLYICSASEIFLNNIKEMIPKDINCNLYNLGRRNNTINGRKVIATCNMFRLVFNDSNALKIGKYVYYSGNVLSLSRKEKIIQEWSSTNFGA